MNEILNHVEFAGFEPDSCLRGTVCHNLEIIMGCAPSDAEPRASVRKTQEGFEGSLRLNSSQGTFSADVKAANPLEAMQRLNERIFEQIRCWRLARTAAFAG